MEVICQAYVPRPDRFTPGEGAFLIHRKESWFDRKGGLDTMEKKIVSSVFYPQPSRPAYCDVDNEELYNF